jgi:hypothetical protein
MIRERASMLRYTNIALLFITGTGCVYCAVRTEYLNLIKVKLCLLRVCVDGIALSCSCQYA